MQKIGILIDWTVSKINISSPTAAKVFDRNIFYDSDCKISDNFFLTLSCTVPRGSISKRFDHNHDED